MNLSALTVCVDYSDLFAKGIERWRDGTDKLLVVTSSSDVKTQVLCDKHRVETFVTDVFYEANARFNKFAALSLAYRHLNPSDWALVFDADIIPQADWRERVQGSSLQFGNLYGAYRYYCAEDDPNPTLDLSKRMPQGWVLGFFTLFHSKDPFATDPLFDVDWPHCGNGDTTFTRRWPRRRQTILRNVPMIHLGEERKNWCGRYRREELRDILKRRRRGEDWERERMPVAPEV